MKNLKRITLILLLLFCSISHAQLISGLQKESTLGSIYVDPTFNDKGFQVGLEISKTWSWGFASAAASTYETIGYFDLVGTFGLNWHMFNTDLIRYYAGFRGGAIFRNSDDRGHTHFGMGGGVMGFDIRLTRWNADSHVFVGFRGWIDYREDQKNRFYGDSDAYVRGLITNNPLLQENGAIVFSFSF